MKNVLSVKAGILIGISLSFLITRALTRSLVTIKVEGACITAPSVTGAQEPLARVEPFNRLVRSAVLSVSFSPDGKRLAAAGYGDGVGLRLWDVEKKAWQLLFDRSTSAAAFSPDGKWIAYAQNQRLSRLDLSTGLGYEVGVQGSDIHSLAYSPDGKLIATGNANGTTIVWDVQARQMKVLGRTTNGDVDTVAFSPSGRWVAAGGDDGPPTLWEVATRSSIRVQGPAGNEVFGLTFSPDERWLAWSASNSKAAPCLWDLKNAKGACLQNQYTNASPYAAAFSPDSKSFVVGWSTGNVTRYSITDKPGGGESLVNGQPPIYSLSFSPNGKILATGVANGAVLFWDAKTGKELAPTTEATDEVAPQAETTI